MSSPQNSLVIPSEASLGDSSGLEGEQDAMSADALAEDERTAEAAASLKDESQVWPSFCCLPAQRGRSCQEKCLHRHLTEHLSQEPRSALAEGSKIVLKKALHNCQAWHLLSDSNALQNYVIMPLAHATYRC